MYYPKLTFASSTIEGIFLFGILCLSNKIYGLESLYYIGKNQKVLNWNPTIGQWATGLLLKNLMKMQVKEYNLN